MDSETILAITKLVRARSAVRARMAEGDPRERLGAQRALEQFAKDLEVMSRFAASPAEEGRE